jgi:hypothetical protein
MKIAFVIALAISSAWASSASAKDVSTCKVKTNDVGTIIGKGRSPSAAFEDAAVKCFERHADLHQMTKGKKVDEDAGLVMIDTCANIKCTEG